MYAGAVFIQQSLGWDMYLSIVSVTLITAVYTIIGEWQHWKEINKKIFKGLVGRHFCCKILFFKIWVCIGCVCQSGVTCGLHSICRWTIRRDMDRRPADCYSDIRVRMAVYCRQVLMVCACVCIDIQECKQTHRYKLVKKTHAHRKHVPSAVNTAKHCLRHH